MLELVDKVDHVLAHGRSMDAVNETAVFESGILSFHFFDDLFAKRTDFGRTRDRHVLVAFVPEGLEKKNEMIHQLKFDPSQKADSIKKPKKEVIKLTGM